MPLSPGGRSVAVVLQYFSRKRAALWDVTGVSIPVVRQLCDLATADAVMIPTGQHRRPRGRAHSRGVESVVRDSFLNDTVHCRGLDFAAEGGRQAGSSIVDQHNEDVGGVGGKATRLNTTLVNRFLHRAARNACRWRWGKWQGILLDCFVVGAHLLILF